jgi:hypothetical protein
LFRAAIERTRRDPETETAIELEACPGGANRKRTVIDAEEGRGAAAGARATQRRGALVPDRSTGPGRKPQQFERMAIRIPELEGPHPPARRRQPLRSAGAHGVPVRLRAQVRIRGVDVADHDRAMFEPQVVAAAAGRVGPMPCAELHQAEFVRAEDQHGFLCCGFLQSGFRRGVANRGMFLATLRHTEGSETVALDGALVAPLEAECPHVKVCGATHVCDHTAHAHDALHANPGRQRCRGGSLHRLHVTMIARVADPPRRDFV